MKKNIYISYIPLVPEKILRMTYKKAFISRWITPLFLDELPLFILGKQYFQKWKKENTLKKKKTGDI